MTALHRFPNRLQSAALHPAGLGAHWDGRGTHFAVFAEGAERVELCLFDGVHKHETARLQVPDCADGIWNGYLPEARPGQQYGYRVFGPYDPKRGLRFNHHKLLLDPYARRLAGRFEWHDALYGYRVDSPKADLSFDRRDSAQYLPKAVIGDERFDWGDDRAPRVPWADTVIYETHVRGFSKLRHDLPERDRGTFAALGHPATIEYLRRLGVTTIELLPIHAFVSERALVERGLTNYWGYNTLAFFAPQSSYLSDGTLGQIKWAVRQLHAAGIEVILDVVYNHSCEGGEFGPTVSFRGLSNGAYYRLNPDAPRHYVDYTGCANSLNFTHPRVIQLTLDSLRYWVQEFHVDGFRFDLGVTLGREAHGGFDPGAGFFDALLQDPLLSRVKRVVEPWDAGPDGYQLGRHPPGIAEWNGQCRDDLRRFWRGDRNMRGALAARLQGSADLFDHRSRRTWASVNFLAVHDGFTLHDWASYDHKHNEANGEDNRDGPAESYSTSFGAEGPTGDAAIVEARERAKRAALATLACAHGTPMILGGDEFGRTQGGNNNAYCHDTPLSWLDWDLAAAPAGASLRDFTARALALRRELATLRSPIFRHAREELLPGVRDVDWFAPGGTPMNVEDWQHAEGRALMVRRAELRADGRIEVSLLLLNAAAEPAAFTLPGPRLDWWLRLNSAAPEQPETAVAQDHFEVAARSVQLLSAYVTPTP